MATGDTFLYFPYMSDIGSQFTVKLSAKVAAAGGFVGGQPTPPGSVPVWPYGAHNLRHVTGKSNAGKRARIPIGLPTFNLFITGGFFTIDAGVFSVTGYEGERRVATNVA